MLSFSTTAVSTSSLPFSLSLGNFKVTFPLFIAGKIIPFLALLIFNTALAFDADFLTTLDLIMSSIVSSLSFTLLEVFVVLSLGVFAIFPAQKKLLFSQDKTNAILSFLAKKTSTEIICNIEKFK